LIFVLRLPRDLDFMLKQRFLLRSLPLPLPVVLKINIWYIRRRYRYVYQFNQSPGILILIYSADTVHTPVHVFSCIRLRWLNTVFDTCVSVTFFSKTLDPSVVKNGSKQVNNTNFGFLIVKLTYVPLPWQQE